MRDLRRAVKLLPKLFNLKASDEEQAHCLAHSTLTRQKFPTDLILLLITARQHRLEGISQLHHFKDIASLYLLLRGYCLKILSWFKPQSLQKTQL